MSVGQDYGEAPQVVRPAADTVRTAGAEELLVDLPGVKREDARLTLQRSELLLEATVAEDVFPGEAAAGRLPRQYRRLFGLPADADVAGIRATLHDGVFQVVIPRRADGEPARTIEIE